MATRVRAVLATKWASQRVGQAAKRHDPELVGLVAFAPGDSVTDITGQADGKIGVLNANIYLVEMDVAPATASAINGLPDVVVLASEQYEDTTEGVGNSNFDSVPTAGQLTAFADALKARFPGVDDGVLQKSGRNIFRAGLTRRQIIQELIQRFGEL